MSTTTVDPVEAAARERLADRPPFWRRTIWRAEGRSRMRDSYYFARQEPHFWRGVIAGIVMFFAMWLWLVPMLRSILVPILAGVFALPHAWWWLLRLMAWLGAVYFLFTTAKVTAEAVMGTRSSLAWLRPFVLCVVLSSIPFSTPPYLNLVPRWSSGMYHGWSNWFHGWAGHPLRNPNLPHVVEGPHGVPTPTCGDGLSGSFAKGCDGRFLVNEHTYTVHTQPSKFSNGTTTVTLLNPGRPPATWVFPFAASAVNVTRPGDSDNLRLSRDLDGVTEYYDGSQAPKE